MRINIHAGHNRDGRIGCGAIGFIRESTEARNVASQTINQLRSLGHTVYDCTVDDAPSITENLNQIVAKCNAHSVDLDVSVHFNYAANDSKGNGKTTGVEVYVYDSSSKAIGAAQRVANAIASLGFTNRGVKYGPNLRVIRATNSPAILIECCFVDDKDDVELYNATAMATAIVYGLTGQKVSTVDEKPDTTPVTDATSVGNPKQFLRVQVGAYSVPSNAEAMKARLLADGYDAIIVNG